MSCPGDDVKVIHSVDPLTVKMNRALYDPCDARSLRDEILDLQAKVGFIVVEFLASDAQAQLLIREMIEDSPSSVAHSVHKRILYKTGLLFIVRLGHAHSASPELVSRASIIL
ncbi:hypothetical protein AB1Y20_010044 [Prymnesium parvum]|uniref:Uncharacterized protein n=1 Tax=Prymnesium parvum TaxID=97485 RepID=A0AB34K3T4_PRYPA|mmetsp:Transcript_14985/g.37398  ORF Transcript_14985/g.37398 Transcript_14985/m.37398 type:complete len:113 (-) Transcript_14985:353-691(-)